MTIFILDIILWVFTLIALILAFTGAKAKRAVLGIMIFCSLLLLAISIAYLWYLWGIAGMSGICGLARGINVGSTDILQEVNMDSDMSLFV